MNVELLETDDLFLIEEYLFFLVDFYIINGWEAGDIIDRMWNYD